MRVAIIHVVLIPRILRLSFIVSAWTDHLCSMLAKTIHVDFDLDLCILSVARILTFHLVLASIIQVAGLADDIAGGEIAERRLWLAS